MNDILRRLYHRLPPVARSVAASTYGFYLRSQRYSAQTGRLVQEAREREQWTPEQWRVWREARLALILHRAATRVPFYRDQWRLRRTRGDRSSWQVLANWPVLEKEPLRTDPLRFVADDCAVRNMVREHTSGSSGSPLDLWFSRETIRAWYALFEARTRHWYNVSRFDRWAIFGGQLVVPVTTRRPPFWVWNAGLQQLYVSSYHLAPELIAPCLDALRRHRVTYVLGYTSSLHAVAQQAIALGIQVPLKVAITNGEPLLEHQRDVIARAFGCAVRETYGMAELVAAAGECEARRLHLWPEVGWLEVVDDAGPAAPGQPGDLVCTSLLNADMPLIRYRVGDRGAAEAGPAPCGCGCLLPTLAYVEGRSDDVLYTSDGRRIGRLDPVFKGSMPLREAQIIQDAIDRVRVRYVPAAGFTVEHGRLLIERLQARMGPVEVILEEVDHVARTRNGKFRGVVCNLGRPERELACRT